MFSKVETFKMNSLLRSLCRCWHGHIVYCTVLCVSPVCVVCSSSALGSLQWGTWEEPGHRAESPAGENNCSTCWPVSAWQKRTSLAPMHEINHINVTVHHVNTFLTGKFVLLFYFPLAYNNNRTCSVIFAFDSHQLSSDAVQWGTRTPPTGVDELLHRRDPFQSSWNCPLWT